MALNPRIKTFEFGIEEISSCKVYPLSIADQTTMSNKIMDLIASIAPNTPVQQSDEELLDQTFGDAAEAHEDSFLSDAKMAGKVVKFVEENLEEIVKLVTREEDRPKMTDLDNVQFMELVELIAEVNYFSLEKNVMRLVQKAKGLLGPKK